MAPEPSALPVGRGSLPDAGSAHLRPAQKHSSGELKCMLPSRWRARHPEFLPHAGRLPAWRSRGAGAEPGADPRADAAGGVAGDVRGLALRSAAGRAGAQAGRRRRDRGGVPAARLSHHAVALWLHAAFGHGPHAPAAPHFVHVQDVPGGQILGPTYDYTQRLLDFRWKPGARPMPCRRARKRWTRPCRASPTCWRTRT